MFVDFKISHIMQGHLYTNVLAHIYLGDVTTEDEEVPDDGGHPVIESVTRYRRIELIDTVVLEYNETKTEDEIQAVLKQRLATAREGILAVEEQRLA